MILSNKKPGVSSRFQKRGFKFVLLALTLPLLSGCLGGGTPSATYDLSVVENFSNVHGYSKAQILVPIPTALKALDDEGIVIRPSDYEIQYLPNARWPDRLPRVFQSKLVEALENTGRIKAVGKPGDGLVVEYQIVTDIRAFEIRTGEVDEAVIQLSAKIVNDRFGRVRASKIFEARVPSGVSTKRAIRGLNAAMNAILKDMVHWVLKKV